jgi:hypothetical protein
LTHARWVSAEEKSRWKSGVLSDLDRRLNGSLSGETGERVRRKQISTRTPQRLIYGVRPYSEQRFPSTSMIPSRKSHQRVF